MHGTSARDAAVLSLKSNFVVLLQKKLNHLSVKFEQEDFFKKNDTGLIFFHTKICGEKKTNKFGRKHLIVSVQTFVFVASQEKLTTHGSSCKFDFFSELCIEMAKYIAGKGNSGDVK